MSESINPYTQYMSILIQDYKVEKMTDLVDCLAINDLLSRIPQFPKKQIQEVPITFAHFFSNLKETYKRIQVFWNEVLDRELQCGQIDLVDIAHNMNEKEFFKIVDIFIQSAVLSSQKDFFITKMLQTSNNTQQYFMKIVESTLDERRTFSPRKKQEQRLYDKLIQLDHENENLQNVITEICQQKYEIQIHYRQLFGKIAEKDSQILKMAEEAQQTFQTPQRKRGYGAYDSIEKNIDYIERLKMKILQISRDHEKQIISLNQKIQCFNVKVIKLEELQNQIDLYKVKIESSQKAIEEYEQLSKKYIKMKIEGIEKDQIIAEQARKIKKQTDKIRELEDMLIESNIEIQRKNVKIQGLSKISPNSSFSEDSLLKITPISLQKSISSCSCDNYCQKFENIHETNSTLRSQVEGLQQTTSQNQRQIRSLKKLIADLKIKNQNLSEFIEENLESSMSSSTLCLNKLKLYTRDKTIRNKLRETLETVSTIDNRTGRRFKSRGKQNSCSYGNEEFEESEILSVTKSRNSSSKKHLIQERNSHQLSHHL